MRSLLPIRNRGMGNVTTFAAPFHNGRGLHLRGLGAGFGQKTPQQYTWEGRVLQGPKAGENHNLLNESVGYRGAPYFDEWVSKVIAGSLDGTGIIWFPEYQEHRIAQDEAAAAPPPAAAPAPTSVVDQLPAGSPYNLPPGVPMPSRTDLSQYTLQQWIDMHLAQAAAAAGGPAAAAAASMVAPVADGPRPGSGPAIQRTMQESPSGFSDTGKIFLYVGGAVVAAWLLSRFTR